jgi:hypothetical protein
MRRGFVADDGDDGFCGVALAALRERPRWLALRSSCDPTGLDCRTTPQLALGCGGALFTLPVVVHQLIAVPSFLQPPISTPMTQVFPAPRISI